MNKNVRFRAEPPPDYDDSGPDYDDNDRQPASEYNDGTQAGAVGPYEELPGNIIILIKNIFLASWRQVILFKGTVLQSKLKNLVKIPKINQT